MEVVPPNANSRSRLGRLVAKYRDKAYRDSYVRLHTKQFLARQMRAFRGGRTQTEFAEVLGVSQSVVSERIENPKYGNWNLNTLFETADKLEIAVFVRFVDFETFLRLSDDMSENAVRPPECDPDILNALAEREESQAQSSALRAWLWEIKMTREQMIDLAVRYCWGEVDFCRSCVDSGTFCRFCREDAAMIRVEFRRIANEQAQSYSPCPS